MAKKSGTIDLEESRVIKGVVPTRGTFSVQMLSDDVSATTTFTLELSADGTNYDVAVENGVDISDTLVVDKPKVISVSSDAGMYWQINFAGATTGNVEYVINAV